MRDGGSSGLAADDDEVPEVDDGDWIARIDDQGNNDVMRRLLAFFAEHSELVGGKGAPEQLCSNCYDSLKKCEVPNRSVLNQFVAEKWPHLPELNFIERLLIQVRAAFFVEVFCVILLLQISIFF